MKTTLSLLLISLLALSANAQRRIKVVKEKLPPFLQSLHGRGLIASVDKQHHVVGLSVGDVIDNDIVAKFKSLPHLRRLDIQAAKKVTGESLKHIAQIPSLQWLQFYSIKLRDQYIKPLQKLKNLESLSLIECNLGDVALYHIGQLKQLRVLKVAGNRMTIMGVKKLAELKNLEELDLSHSNWVGSRMQIDNRAMPTIAQLTKLKRLNLSGSQITDEGLAELTSLQHLERIQLSRTQITSNSLKHLARLPLKWLTLAGPSIGDEGAVHLDHFKHLERLSITFTRLSDDAYRHVGKLQKLKNLEITSPTFSDAGVAHLIKLKNLRSLMLRTPKVTDAGLAQVAKMTSLRRLTLSGFNVGAGRSNPFTTQGYRQLQKIKSLRWLSLLNQKVEWTALKGLKQIKSIDMLMVQIPQSDVLKLQRALPNARISAAWGGISIPPAQSGVKPAFLK